MRVQIQRQRVGRKAGSSGKAQGLKKLATPATTATNNSPKAAPPFIMLMTNQMKRPYPPTTNARIMIKNKTNERDELIFITILTT